VTVRGGFTPLLNSIIDDRTLSAGAFRLYAALASYCWNGSDTCWPAASRLAEQLGVAERTVQRQLDQLVTAGYVRKHCRPGRTNEYELVRRVPLGTLRSEGSDVVCSPLRLLPPTPASGVPTTSVSGVRVAGGAA